jgi:cold shock CspA family protein
MPLTGTLRSWDDGRGFGFIAPTNGGRELFVHISAFPQDGSRPAVGESLTYELGQGKGGKPQAVRVQRQALREAAAQPSSPRLPPVRHLPARPARVHRRRSPFAALAGVAIAVVLGAYGYSRYKEHAHRLQITEAAQETAPAAAPPAARQQAVHQPSAEAAPSPFHCDGRTHCSQMTSCREATFFLRNCPGTQMDGNNDGVPCEQQWCTGPSAR